MHKVVHTVKVMTAELSSHTLCTRGYYHISINSIDAGLLWRGEMDIVKK